MALVAVAVVLGVGIPAAFTWLAKPAGPKPAASNSAPRTPPPPPKIDFVEE